MHSNQERQKAKEAPMAITINLVHDWETIQLEEFHSFITHWGFESQTLDRYLNASIGTEDWKRARDEAVVTWFNYSHRRIPAQPRMLVPNHSLVCPSEVSQGWTMLQQEISDGVDLTPRLSRKIENADYNDGMLNDWGFYHFHLGTKPDANHPRLIEGTCIVLVAHVTSSEFYPIDFATHGQWGDISILKKAISTFPDLFERVRLKGVTDIAGPCTGEDIVSMRKQGLNLFVKVNGKVYAPLGMGITTAGTSIMATRDLDMCRQRLQRLEAECHAALDARHPSGEVRLVRTPAADQQVLKRLTSDYALVLVNPS
jgi:hypothetical protein